ncbi:DoxX family protein [Amycolatopsis japonica]|uniref:DoxX family protein n=1 Tax=Amycolatopsis japonica TaxID=208439 RepID=UPI0036726B75
MLTIGIAVVRVVLGAFVAAHGVQKLTHFWGGGGLAASTKEFQDDGFVGGKFTAFAAGGVQVAGGTLLIAGFLTPLASAMVIGPMVVATTVKAPVGFWSQDGGYEYPLFLALLGIGVAFTGPGAFSFDHATGLSAWYGQGAWSWVPPVAATAAGVFGGLGARVLLHRPALTTSRGRTL